MSQATTADVKLWGGGRSPFNVSYGKMMMWFFLLSDAFTFGAFLISYGTTRFFSAVWPDANHVFHAFPFAGEANLPLLFVSLMTFILIMSSVTMVLAVHAGHYGDRNGVIKWLLWTIVGGICFLSCQAWEWTHLHSQGAWWGSFTDAATPISHIEHFFNMKEPAVAAALPAHGMQATHDFYNYFFTITGFHGGHVASGVVFLIMVLINTVNGTYDQRGHYEMVEKIGLYWHFVDLVWVFVFTCFYLL
ncbi:MAG: cytochrome oxidase subunit III [Bacteroidetes bacterium 43-93]|nr:cytochrome c oxidase subunit 3 [Bacteroidota bacterium]OJW98132.1 MAG: cytochrome oxidase subunit III [Bacteroidetes bacterium 43-93]